MSSQLKMMSKQNFDFSIDYILNHKTCNQGTQKSPIIHQQASYSSQQNLLPQNFLKFSHIYQTPSKANTNKFSETVITETFSPNIPWKNNSNISKADSKENFKDTKISRGNRRHNLENNDCFRLFMLDKGGLQKEALQQQQKDLPWLQCTRYKPPKLPSKIFIFDA